MNAIRLLCDSRSEFYCRLFCFLQYFLRIIYQFLSCFVTFVVYFVTILNLNWNRRNKHLIVFCFRRQWWGWKFLFLFVAWFRSNGNYYYFYDYDSFIRNEWIKFATTATDGDATTMHLHALMFFLHFSLAKLNTNSPSLFECVCVCCLILSWILYLIDNRFVWRELTCHKLIDDYDGDDDMKERDDSGA